jgi:hypothetical protein
VSVWILVGETLVTEIPSKLADAHIGRGNIAFGNADEQFEGFGERGWRLAAIAREEGEAGATECGGTQAEPAPNTFGTNRPRGTRRNPYFFSVGMSSIIHGQ